MHSSLLNAAQIPRDILGDLIAGLLRVYEPVVSLRIARRPPLSSKCTATPVLIFGHPAVRTYRIVEFLAHEIIPEFVTRQVSVSEALPVHEYIITNRTVNAIKYRNCQEIDALEFEASAITSRMAIGIFHRLF